MASAAADTFATEIGEVHGGCPRLVTNMKKTAVGTNGGVTLVGCFAAFLGSALIAVIPCFSGVFLMVFSSLCLGPCPGFLAAVLIVL